MYGLAAHEEKDENSARWMEIAKGITNTCHESYDRSDTKLGMKLLFVLFDWCLIDSNIVKFWQGTFDNYHNRVVEHEAFYKSQGNV